MEIKRPSQKAYSLNFCEGVLSTSACFSFAIDDCNSGKYHHNE